MGHKATLIEQDIKKLLAMAMAFADKPLLDFNFDDDSLNVDIDALMAIPIRKPTMLPELDAIAAPLSGRTRISIRVQNRVKYDFKRQAAKTGTPYQTLMNNVLKAAAEGFA